MEEKEEQYIEPNLLDYGLILNKHRNLILFLVVISVILTGIISFLSPKIYQARAVIMPASQPAESGGMNAIASQFGISSPASSNSSEVISLLQSTILMERVIKRYNLLPVLLKKTEKGTSDDKKMWNAIRYLKERFRVNHNRRDGVIELSAEFSDPKSAADILQNILTELTDYMSSEAKRVADTNKKYLESLIDINTDPLIQQKIYSLIAQQIETSMMAEVKENFAYKLLDPPKVPDRKIRPSIRKNVMLSFFIALFSGIFIAFFLDFWDNMKKRER